MKDSIIQLILKKELREYCFKKNNLEELKNKIENLKDTKYNAGAIWSNCEPVKGGGSKQEDKLIEINIKFELMEQLEEKLWEFDTIIDSNNRKALVVMNEYGESVGKVAMERYGMVNTDFWAFEEEDFDSTRRDLVMLLTKYALTPVEEREKEEKYRLDIHLKNQ